MNKTKTWKDALEELAETHCTHDCHDQPEGAHCLHHLVQEIVEKALLEQEIYQTGIVEQLPEENWRENVRALVQSRPW